MASEMTPISSARLEAAELHQADRRGAGGEGDRAEVGDEVQHAGHEAPDGRVLHADPEEREPGRQRDQQAGEHLHQQVALDLLGDFVERLHRQPLLAEPRPDDLHQLAPERVAGGEQEEGQEQHDRRLADQRHQTQRAGPEVVLDVELRPFDLHPGHAARARGGRSGRLFKLARGLLDLVDRAGRFRRAHGGRAARSAAASARRRAAIRPSRRHRR